MTGVDEKLYLRHGSAGDGAFSLAVTPERAGWAYAGLRVLTLPPGAAHTWATGDDELLVLPLAGSAVVTCDGETAYGIFEPYEPVAYEWCKRGVPGYSLLAEE